MPKLLMFPLFALALGNTTTTVATGGNNVGGIDPKYILEMCTYNTVADCSGTGGYCHWLSEEEVKQTFMGKCTTSAGRSSKYSCDGDIEMHHFSSADCTLGGGPDALPRSPKLNEACAQRLYCNLGKKQRTKSLSE